MELRAPRSPGGGEMHRSDMAWFELRLGPRACPNSRRRAALARCRRGRAARARARRRRLRQRRGQRRPHDCRRQGPRGGTLTISQPERSPTTLDTAAAAVPLQQPPRPGVRPADHQGARRDVQARPGAELEGRSGEPQLRHSSCARTSSSATARRSTPRPSRHGSSIRDEASRRSRRATYLGTLESIDVTGPLTLTLQASERPRRCSSWSSARS